MLYRWMYTILLWMTLATSWAILIFAPAGIPRAIICSVLAIAVIVFAVLDFKRQRRLNGR